MAADKKPSNKGEAWFCTTGLTSDIVIEVEDMTFHLHKFPLMSKSQKLHQLITEQETNPTASSALREKEEEEEDPQDPKAKAEATDEIEEFQSQISLPDFPGGSETFQMAAKFCYGVKIDLTATTVAPLLCAAEFLEMTEEYSADNLISKTERFLSQNVLRSLKDSVKALRSCERVMPMAETLGITQRCLDSISSRSSSTDPALFGWPVTDASAHEHKRSTSDQVLWNGIESAVRRKGRGGAGLGRSNNGEHTWFEELSLLTLPWFKRVISAMKTRDPPPEIIESCLMYYAKKHIPGIIRLNRKPSSSSSSIASESDQREVLETIVSNLPLQRSSSRSSTATRFLFGLLRTANILNAPEACRSVLEKKIGSQLEQATLDDLLIPSYSYLTETLYDVDCVERILGYFLDGIENNDINAGDVIEEAEVADGGATNSRSPALMLVGKLIDGFLGEIASDANLKPDRFYKLAISLPEQARIFDDGLYRAVDIYLKAHPWIPEAEREKVCGVMDCQKLTLEACTHAAQNERLPLRAVVQVLFFEQLQLRHAIAGTLIAADADGGRLSAMRGEEEEEEEEEEENVVAVVEEEDRRVTWRAAVRENQVLRLDMDSMRTRVNELERECSSMKKVIEKIDKDGPGGGKGGWRERFGCKFKTQVCDSHEQTVVKARKGRRHASSPRIDLYVCMYWNTNTTNV